MHFLTENSTLKPLKTRNTDKSVDIPRTVCVRASPFWITANAFSSRTRSQVHGQHLVRPRKGDMQHLWAYHGVRCPQDPSMLVVGHTVCWRHSYFVFFFLMEAL